jgi:adenylate kinase family enzyme
MSQTIWDCVLLIGPTASGKTPLGQLLDEHGLWGRACVHFDFGANLRACASGGAMTGPLTTEECTFLRQVVDSGVLLEDEHFPIARKIFETHLENHGVDSRALTILNGLPRHEGQARAMESFTAIVAVASLTCDADTVLERIKRDTGGDRACRDDDKLEKVRERIAVFAKRTAPLLAHYRARGVPVIDIHVDAKMQPGDVRVLLEAARPPDESNAATEGEGDAGENE